MTICLHRPRCSRYVDVCWTPNHVDSYIAFVRAEGEDPVETSADGCAGSGFAARVRERMAATPVHSTGAAK